MGSQRYSSDDSVEVSLTRERKRLIHVYMSEPPGQDDEPEVEPGGADGPVAVATIDPVAGIDGHREPRRELDGHREPRRELDGHREPRRELDVRGEPHREHGAGENGASARTGPAREEPRPRRRRGRPPGRRQRRQVHFHVDQNEDRLLLAAARQFGSQQKGLIAALHALQEVIDLRDQFQRLQRQYERQSVLLAEAEALFNKR